MVSLLLGACSGSQPIVNDEDYQSSDAMMEESSSLMMEESSSAVSGTTVSDPLTAEPRILNMTVTDWAFSPTVVNARKGERVTLRLTGGEGVHGFRATQLGIDEEVKPGETIEITIPTDTVGTFEFACDVPCGPGHKDMKGTIVISA